MFSFLYVLDIIYLFIYFFLGGEGVKSYSLTVVRSTLLVGGDRGRCVSFENPDILLMRAMRSP